MNRTAEYARARKIYRVPVITIGGERRLNRAPVAVNLNLSFSREVQRMATKRKKMSLRKAVEELTAMAEKHLSTLPEEEQEARVAALARRDFKSGRAARTKSSQPGRIRASRASNRGH